MLKTMQLFRIAKRIVLHTATLTTIAGLILVSTTQAFVRQIDSVTHQRENEAKDRLVTTASLRAERANQRNQELENNLKEKQDELAAKDLELTAKRQEIDRAQSELTAKVKALASAESQLSANAAELKRLRDRPPLFSFSVDSTTLVDADAKKESVKQVVTDAYPIIEEVYGKPYLLHAVTISFVDSFTNPNAAAEIVIANGNEGLSITIKIKDFDRNNFSDVNGIIHELVHSFHGLAFLEPVAYEEGITVAAADAVMSKLIALGKIPNFSPLYLRITATTYQTSPLILPENGSQFYGSTNVANYYQLAGYGWYELYKADSGIFRNFNEIVYEAKRQGQSLSSSQVLTLLAQSTNASISGMTSSQWVQTKAFVLQ